MSGFDLSSLLLRAGREGAQMRRPPRGPVIRAPDLDGSPQSSGVSASTSQAALAACLVLASASVVLHAYTRIFRLRRAYWEDYVMLLSMALYFAQIYYLCRVQNSDKGWFVHVWDFRPRDVPQYIHMTSYAINTHLATMTLLKACVLWQWARMLRPPVGGSRSRSRAHDPFFFWSCHALAAANAVFYAVAILVFNVGCSWSRGAVGRGGEGGCAVDARAFALASAALAFILDVLALLLPQGFIWTPNVPRRRKLGISIVCAVGLIAVVAAGFRLAALTDFQRGDDNVTWTLAVVALWNLAEATAAVLVYAAPSAPSALAHMASALSRIGGIEHHRKGATAGGSDDDDNNSGGKLPYSPAWPLGSMMAGHHHHNRTRKKSRSRGPQRVYREITDGGDSDGGTPPRAPPRAWARVAPTGLQRVRITASFRGKGEEDLGGRDQEQQEEDQDIIDFFGDELLHKGRILRTTRFEARRDSTAAADDLTVADDTFNRQHPWADRRIR